MSFMCLTSVKVVIVKFIECEHIDVYAPAGLWSSPTVRGTRPPPCAGFTLTSIDNHRAVFFGGRVPGRGRVNDLYIIDFDTMV